MRNYIFLLIISTLMIFCLPRITNAAHPLISDDTATQGRGKWQVELLGQYDFDDKHSTGPQGIDITSKNREAELKSVITYGLVDKTDLIFSVPYQWKKNDNEGYVSRADGFSDTAIEVKWRFFEREWLNVALKPGVTFPTGDKDKDLGTGRAGCSLFVLATKESPSWAFNFNIGYKRNENKINEREDIWHLSLSSEYKVKKNLRLVGNIGAEKNTDSDSRTAPAFVLAGFIYSFAEFCDFDFGVKVGLNEPETDLTLLTGLTFRFLTGFSERSG